jgi:hypothetical protein
MTKISRAVNNGEYCMHVKPNNTSESKCKAIALRSRRLPLWLNYATQNLDGYPKFPDEPAPEEKAHGNTKQPKAIGNE